jgi:hypothetical protein
MKILIVLALALTLLACGPDDSARAEPAAKAEPTVGKEVADHYNRAMDRARAVEDQAMEQKQKVEDALKAAEAAPNRD